GCLAQGGELIGRLGHWLTDDPGLGWSIKVGAPGGDCVLLLARQAKDVEGLAAHASKCAYDWTNLARLLERGGIAPF
ncbi:MAG: hypothetical protein L0387_35540, partial [Acidobacteria bacterium]|nr:hypothetical protein [Acidobacteriota bacterium]